MAKETTTDRTLRGGKRVPYLLILPGVAFLFFFFVVPLITLFKISLSTKPDRLRPEYNFTWEWDNYSQAFTRFGGHLVRAFAFAGCATVLCIIVAYPIAYFIAFKAGKFKNILLGLVMIPFFTSFLLRTIAWQSLLADAGPVVGFLKAVSLDGLMNSIGLMQDGRILQTSGAVIGGLTYNFLPFMLMPIYVSLEKIDPGLVDAASDLYASFRKAFTKVILPLSLPGVFAGTLLTFIPATGDYINAEFLGDTTSKKVIGNAVRTQFLNQNDYPAAAAISFVLMAVITSIVFLYAKLLGTEDLA